MDATTVHQDDGPSAGGAAATVPAVQAAGLSLDLDDKPILREISLDVPPGQAVALLGANGAGKTMLLKVLATLVRPTSGQLRLFGHAAGPNADQARARIGVVAHQSMLYRDLSARENLEFFGRLYDVADPPDRAAAMLARVALADRADDPVWSLSRGMIQRVAIARALVHDPALLLADEPFDGLDAPSAQSLEALLRALCGEGKTLILSNCDIPRMLRLVDDVIVLRRGRVVLDRPVAAIDVAAVLKEITSP